jgi:anti-anti-sigma factor
MDRQCAMMMKLPEIFGKKQAQKLKREMATKLRNGRHSIVLDFSRVKQIDLDGLESLLQCMEEVARRDGAFAIREVSPEVATILELTRVNRLLEKFPTLEAQPTFTTATEAAGAIEIEEVRTEETVQPQPAAA